MSGSRRYRRRLARGRRFWDLGARLGGVTGRVREAGEPQWRLAVDNLGLRPGEQVLDFGCGTGNALPALRGAVGETGRVVGLDNSRQALAAAARLVAGHGWRNVELRHGDGSAAVLEPGRYDAAVASYSLSTMPELDAAVEQLHAALRAGGRAFVADMFFGPHPVARLLRLLYRGVSGSNGDDVPAALRRRFRSVLPVVDADGRALVLPPGRSWPPLCYVVAVAAGPDGPAPATEAGSTAGVSGPAERARRAGRRRDR